MAKELKRLSIKKQKKMYKKFIKKGNYDSFEGFIKMLGNSLVDTGRLEFVEIIF